MARAVRMHIDRVELAGFPVRVAGSKTEDSETHNLLAALDDEVNSRLRSLP